MTLKTLTRYVQKNHCEHQIVGDKNEGVKTRRRLSKASEHVNICLLSEFEPKIFSDACKDEQWMKNMEEELNLIEKNHTWELVPKPTEKYVIGTKWVF